MKPLTPLPYIPPEIVTEILTRLQVKPLLKFKCVCNSWLSLISSAQFVKAHLSLSSRNPSLLLYPYNAQGSHIPYYTCSLSSVLCNDPSLNTKVLDFHVKDFDDKFHVVGFCNGLFCLKSKVGKLVLCNPSTRKFKTLPPPARESIFPITYGFCYDQENDDYKIVEVGSGYTEVEQIEYTLIKVYSVRKNCWRTFDILERGRTTYTGGTSIGGVIYFLEDRPCQILSVDTVANKFSTLEVPNEKGDELVFDRRLGEFGGCLSVTGRYRRTGLVTWVRNRRGSWTKVASVPLAFKALYEFNSLRRYSEIQCRLSPVLLELSSPVYVESLVPPNII